jgi:FtsH-binding integral membrane protein
MYQNNDIETGNRYTQYGAATQARVVGVVDPNSNNKQMINGISPVSIRHGFIRKVYLILFTQLLITCAIATPFVALPSSTIQPFITNNMWLMWVSLAVSISCLFIFACFPSLMRKFPVNYVILFLFTATQGLFIGMICSRYSVNSVLIALGTVTGVTLALTLFAIQTKWDFTGWGPYLLVALLVLMVFGFIIAFFPGNGTATKVYCGIGCLIFSLYLVYDTQLIVGGENRKFQFSVDDYAVAAIALYVDIIQLFLMILTLFGGSRQ